MRIFISLLILWNLSACSKPAPTEQAKTAIPVSVPSAENKTTETDLGDKIQILPFDRKEAEAFAYQGSLKDGAKWRDKNGINLLLVTEAEEKKQGEEDTRIQRLWAYQYVTKAGRDSLYWSIKDFAENWCDEGKGLASPIVVKDLDRNGIGENAFLYNVQGSCDVSPIPYKLMMHAGSAKYVIRGTNDVPIGEGKYQKGEKIFDAAFNTAPKSYKTFASQMWDQYMKR